MVSADVSSHARQVPAAAAPAPAVADAPGGVALLLALLAAITYAVFAHGATAIGDEARLQVALALLVAVAAGGWLWGGLRLAAPRIAWIGIGLLALFAVWNGVTLAWSVAPDRSWVELNRTIAYVLVVLLGVAVGASGRRSLERLGTGYLLVVTVVSAYALGGKVWPGFDFVVDLDHTELFARLRAPLEYWNALALFVVLAAPVALRLATDETRSLRGRLAGLASLLPIVVVAGLTYSRGGIIALAVGLAVSIAAVGPRLRAVPYIAAVAAAAAPALAWAYTRDDLTTNGLPVAERAADGRVLGLLFLLGLAGLLVAGRVAIALEGRVRIPEDTLHRARRAVLVAGAIGVGAIGLHGLVSAGGVDARVRTELDNFTQVREDDKYDPNRLFSTSSGNRWVWWKEAAGAWSDKPVGGWGAGSFPTTHLRYRRNALPVQQPHSVPLQFLAETGFVGAALALAGLLALLAAAIAATRLVAPGPSRGFAAALAGAGVAWFLHGFIDWDWDIPGVSLPAFAFLGALAGRAGAARVEAQPGPVRFGAPAGARVALLSLVTLICCTAAASSVVPAIADSKASGALASLGDDPSPQRIEDAAADAEVATRLNPFSTAGLFASASIAERRGDALGAREFLIDAIRRNPDDVQGWNELARLELQLGAGRGVIRDAALRALALDPRSIEARTLAERAVAFTVPLNESATAVGTPLPSFQ